MKKTLFLSVIIALCFCSFGYSQEGGETDNINKLIQELKDPKNQKGAIMMLGILQDKRAVLPLIPLLNDNNPEVRLSAAGVLGDLKDSRAVEPLIAVLRNEKEASAIRGNAVNSLGSIKDNRAVDALISALKGSDIWVKKQSAWALGELKDKRAIEPLIQALNGKDEGMMYEGDSSVQENAKNALINITGQDFGRDAAKWQEWRGKNK